MVTDSQTEQDTSERQAQKRVRTESRYKHYISKGLTELLAVQDGHRRRSSHREEVERAKVQRKLLKT